MSEIADRFRMVAARFTATADAVPDGAWDLAAPCKGWVARDVVRHMVEWMPGLLFPPAGLPLPTIPSVDDEPAAAWAALDHAIQSTLDDPDLSQRGLELRMGRFTFEQAVGIFCLSDVLVHTWDLARATGLDESLDPAEVHRTLVSMTSFDEELLRSDGQFGPRVEVDVDADEQTKLLAYTGRHP